jgi:hypothetical protein
VRELAGRDVDGVADAGARGLDGGEGDGFQWTAPVVQKWSTCDPAGAKARHHFAGIMYGLKPVPFAEARTIR